MVPKQRSFWFTDILLTVSGFILGIHTQAMELGGINKSIRSELRNSGSQNSQQWTNINSPHQLIVTFVPSNLDKANFNVFHFCCCWAMFKKEEQDSTKKKERKKTCTVSVIVSAYCLQFKRPTDRWHLLVFFWHGYREKMEITRCHHKHIKGTKQRTKSPDSSAAGLGFEARKRD